jgi:ferredoxin-nitrite reductase
MANKIEELKAARDGLDVGADIPRFAALGWEAIQEDDLDRLKWWGIFFRRHTPGYFMMRIRIPNGIATAAQVRALGQIARRFGRGVADITTRQQVQLRWIRINDVPDILNILGNVGLVSLQTGMDNIRNVVGCPVAGLTPGELFDASPTVRAFTDLFVGNKAYTNLPRKFNVTITGCRENCTHAETQDIAMVPATRVVDGETIEGFNVLVGGKVGSGGYRIASPLDAFVTPEQAPAVASTIVLLFRDYGFREARSKARLAFLIEAWGIEKFRRAVEERLGQRLARAGTDMRGTSENDHIGVHRQKQEGFHYVGLCVPVGRIAGEQLEEAARLADVYGAGEVRFTIGQNLILPHIPDEKLPSLLEEPLLRVLHHNPPHALRGLVSCTGMDYCNLALIETKQRALDLARALDQRLAMSSPYTIAWSGCPASCGLHPVADIGLLGKKAKIDGAVVDAVDIFVGGASGPRALRGINIMEDVPCEQLPQIVEMLVRRRVPDQVRRQLRSLQAVEPPPSQPAPEPAARAIVKPDEIAEGTGKRVRGNGIDAAVFKCDGKLYALENRCPHGAAALSRGMVDGEAVVCSGHGYRFNLRTGACADDPSIRAKTYRLEPQEDGFLIVEADPQEAITSAARR